MAESLLVFQIPHIVSDSARTSIRSLLDRPIMHLSLFLQNVEGLCRIIDLPESIVSRVNLDQFLNLSRAVAYGVIRTLSGVFLILLFGLLKLFQIGFIWSIVFDDLTIGKLNGWPIRS